MNQSYRRQNKRNRRKRRIIKIMLLMCLFTLLLVGGGATYLTFKLNSVASSSQQELIRGEKSERRTEAVNPSKDNISVLLLGEDKRPGESRARTDTIMVATFNKEDHSVILTSIPRDSRVEIVGRGIEDKINHAHAFGGIDMAVDTVENLLDIPIDYYAKVNFDAFIAVIDALDGVEIEVPFDFQEKDTSGDWIDFYEGNQFMNGEEALAYVRMRRHPQSGGDLGRGQRQQQMIEAIINKSASLSSITRFDDVVEAIGDNLTMNFSFGNIVALHSYATSLNNIEMLQLEGENLRIDGIYYYGLKEDSLKETQDRLKIHLGLMSAPPSNLTETESTSY